MGSARETVLRTEQHGNQPGEDPARHHPALASQVSAEDLELSQREREMWERYGEVRVDEANPGFWPRRIWDSPDVQMSDAESARLAATLEDVIGADATLRAKKSITAPLAKKQDHRVVDRLEELRNRRR
jgi:hypothetical protein